MSQGVSSSAKRVAFCLAGLLVLALACDKAATGPDIPSSAVPLTAPPQFALWWRVTEACSAATGDFASVSWYVVPNSTNLTFQGKLVDAYWIDNPDRIVLSDAHRNDGAIVRHEMLHALLHRDGHPRSAFLTACGGVVACDGDCAAEAGTYATPPASALEVQPSDVSSRVDLFAPLPAEVSEGGPVAAMITVTNPRTEPVWVKLTPRESGDLQYPAFGVVVDYNDPTRIAALSVDWTEATRFPLGAGESKRWVWDGVLPRGRYGVLGYFNADSLPRQVITVGP
jgi:hypothetical protein